MIAVGANVMLPLFVSTPLSPISQALYDRDPEWTAPLLWRSELASALWGLHRFAGLGREEAVEALGFAVALLSAGERDAGWWDALDLAMETGCSPYDCEYVVLARELGTPLVTWDSKMLGAFPETAATPEQFLRAG